MKFLFLTALLFSQTVFGAVNKTGYSGIMISKTVTLLATTESTAALDLSGFTLVGIILPTTFTGTALTFETSSAIDGTFVGVNVTTSGTALSYTVAQAKYAAIDPKDMYGLNYIKIVSGSNESADRTLILLLKGL